MSDGETFDVFFSYNSKDREAIRQVAEEMRRQDVRVWMDEEDLPLGQPWQPQVEDALKKVRSAIILLGPSGFGDWQEQEAQLCLTQAVKRRIPVIPVLLPGGPDPEALPAFLRERTCADLRRDMNGARLQRLIREIRPETPILFDRTQEGPRDRSSVLAAVLSFFTKLVRKFPFFIPISSHVEDVRGKYGKQIPDSEPDFPRSATAPRLHNLPFLPIGDLLKGRDDDLNRLIANLQNSAQATAIIQTQAIHGLGGIGKTRLAVEYAWRSGGFYDAALFVVADSSEALQSNLVSLARLGLTDFSEYLGTEETETFKAVMRWLRNHSRWLLILDNVDTDEAAKAVREILPQLANGHVLLTSRRREWPSAVKKQPLEGLGPEEAVQFLLQRTKGERTPAADEVEQATRLVENLGGLPLALEQAAAYIAHHQTTFAGYLKDWDREKRIVLEWHDESVMDYPFSVATTWQTTFRQLGSDAAALLRLTAFLAPEPIPEAMFEENESLVKEATEAICDETCQRTPKKSVREALAELASYSMVARSAGTLTIHRLVQEVLRIRIPIMSRQEWIVRSLRLVNAFYSMDLNETIRFPDQPFFQLASLMDNSVFGLGQSKFVSSSETELLMRQTVEICKKALGPKHLVTRRARSRLESFLAEIQDIESKG